MSGDQLWILTGAAVAAAAGAVVFVVIALCEQRFLRRVYRERRTEKTGVTRNGNPAQ